MTNRSPVAVVLLSLVTCFIYAYYWLYVTSEEMSKKGAEMPNFVMLFIPIANILWMLKYCEGVEKVTNGATTKVTAIILLLLLGPIAYGIFQAKFNEVK
jgi:ABC-type transport system involved in cytochrome c biogenesis permease subunit